MENSIINSVKAIRSEDAVKVEPYFKYNVETNKSKCTLCRRELSGHKTGNLIRHLSLLHPQTLLELNLKSTGCSKKRFTEVETSEGSIVKKARKLKVF